ncbi:hypothetical protein CVT24_000850 [Panaeolus cyanescens]|uniref:U4/U6.U5 small nuclear ribonucleoprotein 27kDa protein domain-containing protein n=1 Tax=Panaeolus cyanescens TaxID=181874 RepID=A0A409VVL8_9AGAR|nr:hypothetical protein CVT24_000850 [Panaeolus cyanescens]
MSSRTDHRRKDRSWERDDRERDRGGYSRSSRGGGADRYRDERPKRSSRSRSPGRRGYREGDRDRRGGGDRRDRERDRDYKSHRDDDRRDRDRDRDRRERDDDRYYKDRDDKRDSHRRDDRDTPARDERRQKDNEGSDRPATSSSKAGKSLAENSSSARLNLDPGAPDHAEDGEAMDDTNDDDAAMMAMMGMAGFGSTKGKHVTGNQEGAVNIKKAFGQDQVKKSTEYLNRRR